MAIICDAWDRLSFITLLILILLCLIGIILFGFGAVHEMDINFFSASAVVAVCASYFSTHTVLCGTLSLRPHIHTLRTVIATARTLLHAQCNTIQFTKHTHTHTRCHYGDNNDEWSNFNIISQEDLSRMRVFYMCFFGRPFSLDSNRCWTRMAYGATWWNTYIAIKCRFLGRVWSGRKLFIVVLKHTVECSKWQLKAVS